MKDPATASWGLSISDADFEKLKAGFRPRDMDDRWVFSVADLDQSGNICIRVARSWTGMEVYVLIVTPRDGGSSPKIQGITWEHDKNGIHIADEQAKVEVVILCRVILGCDFDTLPHYDRSLLWNYSAAQTGTN